MAVEVGDTSAELVALEVPEWNASVMVRVFTLEDYSRVKAAASESGILNKHKLLRLLVVHGVVEPQISMEVVQRMRPRTVEWLASKILDINDRTERKR